MSPAIDLANALRDQQTSYPFLVQHIPKDTHEKDEATSSSRQKRRRTSPQDHALLEAAYQRNSKPDKNERIKIVSQVELGEKEVQIWFQNRRQTDRRKSRPLLPHELVPHFRNGIPIEVLQQSPLVDSLEHETHSHPLHTSASRIHSRASSIHELLNPSSSSESKTSASASSTETCISTNASTLSSFERPEEHSHPSSTDLSLGATPVNDEKTFSGRKRAYEEMTGPTSVWASNAAQQQPRLPLQGQGSTVRLSMTAEGAVKIRTSDEETPSPPKERARAPDLSSRRSSGLHRSMSPVGALEMGAQSSLLTIPKVADGKLGRSRDARTWEFYCDSEARDSLTSHAEHERNGSAVGAINLIRSQSQRQLRQMLAPVALPSNARGPAPLGSNAQRSKPKLARAKSSFARLQAVEADSSKDLGKGLRPPVTRSPSGDSDKENWAPGTHASQNPLRRTNASSNVRPVLADNDSKLSYASKLDNEGNKDIRRRDGKENRQPISAGFKEKGLDLDCVQGLLSLSQGAWR